MMDVVFLTDSLTRGGAETQLTRIATTLKQRGWRVGVLTMFPLNDFQKEFDEANIPVIACARVRPVLPLRMTIRMILQLRQWRPRVLVTFSYHSDVMGRVCGRIARVPVIIASLRTAYTKTSLREKVYRLTEAMVDLTASNSRAGLTHMLSKGVLTESKTRVIPNGMIMENFPSKVSREEMREDLGIPPGTFLWLAVGTLRPAKDYPTLLKAIDLCRRRMPASVFQVCIAGGGDAHAVHTLLKQIQAFGLEDVVRYLGGRSDIPRLMRACDAFVQASAWEGLPNTVMEAMASAVPVVTTDVGGVLELIEPGVSGFVAPSRNPEALADQMMAMMSLDPEVRSGMGVPGRARILREFDNNRVIGLWEDTFRHESALKGLTVPAQPPAFILSLDFELFWGMQDKQSIDSYGERILGEREAIPAMLKLFRQYGVKATWAAVGMTLFDNRKELLEHLPEELPTYRLPSLDPYACLKNIGDNEKTDPYHYGLSLVRQILDCEGMELGSHTFSHYYCLEQGQHPKQFQADLKAAVRATERLTRRPVSIVFPRNQYNAMYLSECSKLGFQVFRGNEPTWMYRGAMAQDQSSFMRGARLLDNYLDISGHQGFLPSSVAGLTNCPSSRFLRPYSQRLSLMEGVRLRRICSSMEAAAREGASFHLWWHPHNFGTDLRENLSILDALLRCHRSLRERYGVVSKTMAEFSSGNAL